MKQTTKRTLLALVVPLAAFAGCSSFPWSPTPTPAPTDTPTPPPTAIPIPESAFRAAAERIEASYGYYVDVANIKSDEIEGIGRLLYVVLIKAPFNDEAWAGYDTMLREELRSLITDETVVVYVILLDAETAMAVFVFDAHAIKVGALFDNVLLQEIRGPLGIPPEVVPWLEGE